MVGGTASDEAFGLPAIVAGHRPLPLQPLQVWGTVCCLAGLWFGRRKRAILVVTVNRGDLEDIHKRRRRSLAMNPTTVEADVDVESSSSLPRSEGAAKETTMTSQKQTHDSSDKEDGTTTPPTKTLKQTTISDKQDIDTSGSREGEEADLPTDTETGTILATTKTSKTADVDDEDMREQIASPKKKRGREIDDDAGQDVGEEVLSEEESTSTNTSVVNGGRTTRSAPEKKRPRDTSVPPPTFSADTPNEEVCHSVRLILRL